jgi:hypothetical protein
MGHQLMTLLMYTLNNMIEVRFGGEHRKFTEQLTTNTEQHTNKAHCGNFL